MKIRDILNEAKIGDLVVTRARIDHFDFDVRVQRGVLRVTDDTGSIDVHITQFSISFLFGDEFTFAGNLIKGEDGERYLS